MVSHLNYFRKDEEKNFEHFFYHYSNNNRSLSSFRPGIGAIYQTFNDLFVIAAVIYVVNKEWSTTWSEISDRKLIIPFGFEKEFSPTITFRFGNTISYIYHYELYHRFKNEINFGLEMKPYKKLSLLFATQKLFDDSGWFFGLTFAL